MKTSLWKSANGWRSWAVGLMLSLVAVPPVARSEARPEVRNLIAVLRQPDASLHAKARACQQLGEFGDKEAVPALAGLLSDLALAAYARSGLEGIPDPSAAAALRAAAGRLKGNLRAGVVNSLGVLRDASSVDLLTKLADNPSSGVVRQALLALGRISSPESIKTVRRALSSGPDASRPDAAAAALIAAEFQLADGRDQAAIGLYDAVRSAAVASPYKLAATRGAILARKANGIDLSLQLLKSEEREMRNLVLLTLREIPGDRVGEALIGALEAAQPELQAQLIEAMADRTNPQSVGAIRAKVASERAYVRQAALRALGKIGNSSDADILLKALRENRDPADAEIASASLARLNGADVDAMILKTLAAADDAGFRVALIDILDARSPASATEELIRQAADPDTRIGLAAFPALRSLVGIKEVPALIALTKTSKEGGLRAAAESALYYACTRTSNVAQPGEMVLTELKQAREDLDKASWIRTLASLGYDKALPDIAPILRSPNTWLVTVAIDSLGKWPNPTPVDALLSMVESASNADVRQRALTAAMQLASVAGSDRRTTHTSVRAWFQRAGNAARSAEDKRLVVSGLGRWKHVESFRLLLPYLDDADVKNVAAGAIVSAVEPENRGSSSVATSFPAIVKPALEKVSGMGNPSLAGRIEILRRAIADSASATRQQ